MNFENKSGQPEGNGKSKEDMPLQPITQEELSAEKPTIVDISEDSTADLFLYDVHENPPIPLTIMFALQQALLSLSRSMSTALLIADILCARRNEHFKARLISTTMFMSGLCTLLQNTVGIRLPLYQGPAATYVVPLIALGTLPEWQCPEYTEEGVHNMNLTGNITFQDSIDGDTMIKVQKMMGSLMIAGGIHMLIGLTGLVGVLLRFIGPITVVPALTIVCLYIYKAAVRFARSQMGVALMTTATAVILSIYMGKLSTPIPAWNRKRKWHIKYFPLHKVFSVLLATILGWLICAIMTSAGAFSNDPKSDEYYARTDSRLYVVKDANWFLFPYPGQFGSPGFDVGAFVTFMLGTISSVIDSIGDYYACANVCQVPPPPKHAVNRGIAIEGFMSFMAATAGAGHATSTFAGNIGAIGITRVASLRVFQVVGIMYIVMGVVGKIGAFFVTIPYPVVGGMQIINFGVVAGVLLANLKYIDLSSTRNLAIIGISMLVGLVLPYWIETTPTALNTGVDKLDSALKMIVGNPMFVTGVLACFMDNTVPGTLKERGMIEWQAELGVDIPSKTESSEGKNKELSRKDKRTINVSKVIYDIPFFPRFMLSWRLIKYIPVFPSRRLS